MQNHQTTADKPVVKRYGCEDCGATWERKNQVPERCQPYTVRVKKNPKAFGGYEAIGEVEF